METSECEVCGGARWVCEDHPDKPWDGASDREPPGYRTMIDSDGPKPMIVSSWQTGHRLGRRSNGITPGRPCLSPLAARLFETTTRPEFEGSV